MIVVNSADFPLARCKNGDPDAMFVTGAAQHIAKKICRPCEEKIKCLSYALENQIEWGVWGGKTERERRIILRNSQ